MLKKITKQLINTFYSFETGCARLSDTVPVVIEAETLRHFVRGVILWYGHTGLWLIQSIWYLLLEFSRSLVLHLRLEKWLVYVDSTTNSKHCSEGN